MAEIVRLERKGELESTYENDEVMAAIKERFKAADDMSQEWRQEAITLFDFYAGDQWNEIDKAEARDKLRPALTFNLMAKYIDAVSGLQIANRNDIRYIPREMGDVKVNEILTSAAEWVRDGCDAVAQESEAWRDMLVTGIGATETYVDTMDDPEGRIVIERRDPVEIWTDPAARKMNCVDGRYLIRIRYMDMDEIEERWPDKIHEVGPSNLGIEVSAELGWGEYLHNADEAWRYEHQPFGEISRKTVPVVEYQWYKREKMVRFFTPMGTRDVTPKQAEQLRIVLQKGQIPFKDQSYRGRKFYRAFAAGNTILAQGESPYQQGFTYGLMTGKRDRNANQWHALGRPLKEPQQFVNKILSEAVHIMRTQAKGGLMAEEDAFVDPRRAEDEWASPESIVWMEEGAIQNGKVMPKPQSQIPAGYDKFLSFAMNALPETTGLNLEIMGLANKVQPGIVEAQRKESAMTMLQWAFDSLRSYHMEHGKLLAHYIRDYIADGRLIRITGKQGDEQFVPLIKDKLTFDFDVIVDESPTSANQKEKTFAVMLELLPILQQSGQGIPPEFWEHSPLPSELGKQLADAMRPNPEEQQKQQQIQEQAMQLDFAERQANIEKSQAEAQSKVAGAQLDAAKLELERDKASQERRTFDLEVAKLKKDLMVADAEITAKKAKAEKDLIDAEAQEIENAWVRRHGLGDRNGPTI